MACSRQIQRGHRRTHREHARQTLSATVPGRVRKDAARTGRAKSPDCGRDACHAHRLLDEHHDGSHARAGVRRGHCGGTCRDILWRNGQGRTSTLLQHLLIVPTAFVRQHHTRCRHHEAPPRHLHRQSRPRGRRRSDASRCLRHGIPTPNTESHDRLTLRRDRTAKTHVYGPASRQRHLRHQIPQRTGFGCGMAVPA